uniref:Glycoprotein IX platelet n=1 Tax=Anolis carolinensis TaxID=28377 RepID=G1KVB9_ANOCA|nr:PREDICTED: platelet glycoprotein IX-like [Anolis carolinensis]|eukprot:XP_016847130.1 PREDICTED: platelet glycoprotein IX-like [Anolis carolinensis]
MDRAKIFTAEGLLLLLLLSAAQATHCSPCSCEPLANVWGGWTMDCRFIGLKDIPPLIPNTKNLYLQNNSLTTVPSGALDHLNLKEVDFSNNPWHCDCSILYLKKWLEDFSPAALAKVTCATPVSVKGKALSQLNGNELEGCRKPLPIKCLDFFWRDIALICMAVIAFISTLFILQRAKKLASKAGRKPHSFEVPLLQDHDLESQKSK